MAIRPFLLPLLAPALTLAAACGGPPPEEPPPAPSGPVAGIATAADGLPVHYTVRGSGATALVFVHCWACNQAFWREQVDVFDDDYRVVTLDLGGHGASGAERESWTVDSFASDVVAVVEDLGLERLVLIGHSMGGPVSLAASAVLGDRVLGVVGVDTLQNAELVYPQEMVEGMLQGLESDFQTAMTDMLAQAFSDPADAELQSWALEQALATHPAAAVGALRSMAATDQRAIFESAPAPIRCISAAAGPVPTEVEINRKYADFDVVFMEGVGHFLHLEEPDTFNRLLRDVLTDLTASESRS